MITSTKNPKIKRIRSLQKNARARRKEGVFVVEGVRLLEEALRAGWEFESFLYTEEMSARGQEVVEKLTENNVPSEPVSPHVMQAASDTQTPQGILAILPSKKVILPHKLNFVLILDALRDPGNLGTILRTSAAAGVQVVCILPESVDPYSPKVIRAGMGAHFQVPVIRLDWEEIEVWTRSAGLQVYLADSTGDTAYTQADLVSPMAIVLGGESDGAGAHAHLIARETLHIPMPGGSESLNVAIAAGVLLFEVLRQRRGLT